MGRYVLRRLFIIPLALFVINGLSYIYAHVIQWQYADSYGVIRMRLMTRGRTQAVFPAYEEYVQDLVNLDLGILSGSGESIAKILVEAGSASLGLLALALLVSVPLGFAVGMLASSWRRRRPAQWLTLTSTVGLAMPSFYIGSLLILLSVSYTLWVSRGNPLPFPLAGFGWDLHLVFPLIALSLRPTVQVAQVTAGLLMEELHKDYVVTAKSLGFRWSQIKRRLALKPITAPLILTIAGSMRMLVADLILVEWLFSWPGLGRMLAYVLIPAQITNEAGSPLFLDPPLMAGVMTVLAALFLFADFIASAVVRVIDPRLRSAALGEASHV
jgi:peptide/nickel transport system permease protein